MKALSTQQAFTLVELISVIAILSVIAAVLALPFTTFTSKMVNKSNQADFPIRLFLLTEYIRKQLEFSDFQSISVSASGKCLYFTVLDETRDKTKKSICLNSEELRVYKDSLIDSGSYTVLEKKIGAKKQAFHLQTLMGGKIKKIYVDLYLLSSNTSLKYYDEIFIKSFQN